MGHNNKRIISNSLSMYFRMILVTLVTLYTSRIVLEQLGVVDFGIYNAVGGVVSFFSFIVPTLSSSVQRFLNYEMGRGDYEKVNAVYSMSIVIHILIAAVVVLLGETLGIWFLNTQMNIPEDRMSAANVVLQCSIVSLVSILLSIPYNALIISKQKMKVYAFFTIITVLLKLLTAFLLTFVSIDKLGVYAVMLMIMFVIGRMNAWLYCKIKFKDVCFRWLWDKTMFKRLFSFSLWILYGNIGNMAHTYGINIVLNIFCGPAVNAARAISIQIQHAVNQFTSSFQTAINPQITQSYAANEQYYVEKLFLGCFKGSFVLVAIIAIPMFFEMEYIMHLWLGHFPPHTVSFARLIVIQCFIDALSNPSRILIQSTGKIARFHIVQGTIMMLTPSLSSIVLSIGYDPEIVYMLSIILMSITSVWGYYIVYSQISDLHFNHFFKSLILSLVCCLPSIMITLLVMDYQINNLVRFFVVSLLSLISIIFMSYYLLLNNTEKELLMSYVRFKIRLV